MNLVTSVTRLSDPRQAGAALGADLAQRCAEPRLLLLYATAPLAADPLIEEVRAAFPEAAIAGGTSCRGVLTETGIHVGDHVAAILAIDAASGDFGAAMAPLGDDAAAAAALAVTRALDAADRPHETPGLIWVCPPPGTEEAVLAGLAAAVGSRCPIIGGSSADEAIAGRWRQFGAQGARADHVSVAVLFPEEPFGLAFQSGYAPTADRLRVTAGGGRRVEAFDGAPAGAAYARGTTGLGAIPPDGNILAASTPRPLGRRLGAVEACEEYLLLHPAQIAPDGALSLFANVSVGDDLVVMEGNPDTLVARAEQVAADALDLAEIRPDDAAGGLVIYCGGCMLAVADRLDEVVEGLRRAFRGAPFLTAFTFGEQGATLTAGNQHGNLMIATAAFGRDGF